MKKTIDYIFKFIFFGGLACIILMALYASAKLIIEDQSSPGWVKIVSVIFSISACYMFITKKD